MKRSYSYISRLLLSILIIIFILYCKNQNIVKRVHNFEEGSSEDWVQVLPFPTDTLEGPAHTYENGVLNMKTHKKHATLMIYNHPNINDCTFEAKVLWRQFSTRPKDVLKYIGLWTRFSEKGGYLFGIGKESNIFKEGAAFAVYQVNPDQDDEFTKESFMLKEFEVELNKWYHLKMIVDSTTFKFFLDNKKIGETENSMFKNGNLAIYTVSSAEASFDDIVIFYSRKDK